MFGDGVMFFFIFGSGKVSCLFIKIICGAVDQDRFNFLRKKKKDRNMLDTLNTLFLSLLQV